MHIIGLYSKNPKYTGLSRIYSKAKGVNVWDGSKKIDMSTMGIGCCLLGYNNPFVNYFVKRAINKGSMSSLNCYEDEMLAELLLDQHPFYETVRYARTGGEAMAIALQLAKSYTGSESILTEGYNGWYIKNKNYFKYNYNDHIDLKKKILLYDIKIIIFEAIRNELPKKEYIDALKQAQRIGCVLICDEITSGYRFHYGGYHRLMGLTPDIVVYGKAISNGYPLSVVIGKKDIMNAKSWISSTYWTERIGVTAGLITLKMLKTYPYEYIKSLGKKMIQIWETFAKKYKVKIKVNEVPQLAHFDFVDDENNAKKTYFIKQMLLNDILAGTTFYPCSKHMARHYSKYMGVFASIMKNIGNNNIVIYKDLLENIEK